MSINSKNMAVVNLDNVSKVYGSSGRETMALKSISINARAGELILLLGPSGSGKTTLLTLIAGFQQASAGNVKIFGRRVDEYSTLELQKLRASSIGFIFQTFLLIDALTVLENVMLVAKFAGASFRQAQKRAFHLLQVFGIAHLAAKSPRTLSQGEKQRVAVARALVNEPALIIADEPTASLETKQGLAIIMSLHIIAGSENRCVIVASHDRRIARYADRIMQLQDGMLDVCSPK